MSCSCCPMELLDLVLHFHPLPFDNAWKVMLIILFSGPTSTRLSRGNFWNAWICKDSYRKPYSKNMDNMGMPLPIEELSTRQVHAKGYKRLGTFSSSGSLHNLRPGGLETFREGCHLFWPRIRGGRNFFGLWSRGAGKILTASKGGLEFFRITHVWQKVSP